MYWLQHNEYCSVKTLSQFEDVQVGHCFKDFTAGKGEWPDQTILPYHRICWSMSLFGYCNILSCVAADDKWVVAIETSPQSNET